MRTGKKTFESAVYRYNKMNEIKSHDNKKLGYIFGNREDVILIRLYHVRGQVHFSRAAEILSSIDPEDPVGSGDIDDSMHFVRLVLSISVV